MSNTTFPAARHPHRVHLSEPWAHKGLGSAVTAWLPERSPDTPATLVGRACVQIACGPFTLDLDPTAEELRALAHMLTTLADEMQCAQRHAPEAE